MKDLFGNEHPEPIQPTIHEPRCQTPLASSITLLWQENPDITDAEIIQKLWDNRELVSKGYGFSEQTARSVLVDLRRAYNQIRGVL